ncbi:iron-sulfur cluster insertion protein ErpA [Buchnera aphidicola (Thelaxes californica)]|uniref:Iron-sulfur cluster insertion protein ErpA n=1 Tax=Buchnera aphidicola (Thelaxes californica) TaxID=1315998 RepID=A0A4D6YF71_9GAMM|nr:iron-sulfur cluster insertion protein ErpA [Buchnera aphidicola]QCI26713.1 iron-sulfur cluster insertion protein ErpA [Buchnera aphidicola (Thelaxes californica)]
MIKITEIAYLNIKKKIYYISKTVEKYNFRVYIQGGGCNGFQYKFIIDENINQDDIIIREKNIKIVIDSISFQYLQGSTIDYLENLEGSRFLIKNPQAKNTCGCGLSFNI